MEINILGTIIAAVASFVFGWIWYSEKVFGKKWRELAGISAQMHDEMAQDKQKVRTTMVLYFVSLLILAGFVSYILGAMNISSIGEGWKLMVCVWFGVAVPATIGSVLWERRSWTYYAINVFYILVSMLVSSAILLMF